ncbi:MAG TPA: alpha/beta hydrolase [Mycobacterium sp.]|jgi:pimeloyl-ACP methyl ester carboxylesterase
MTTFALVHGAWHGAWCWERLAPLLKQAGHDVVTPDLPCDDASATTFEPYADIVCAALGGRDDDVVVVGHSLAGPTATLVAARRPVRHLVYLCGAVPSAGRSLIDQRTEQPDMCNPHWDKGISAPDEHLRLTWTDLDAARELLFGDCDEATVMSAFQRLRLQCAHPFIAPFPLAEIPTTPCTSVICTEDQMVYPQWQRRIAREIGAEIVELPGSHSPQLSRPSAVAEVLLRVAGESQAVDASLAPLG